MDLSEGLQHTGKLSQSCLVFITILFLVSSIYSKLSFSSAPLPLEDPSILFSRILTHLPLFLSCFFLSSLYIFDYSFRRPIIIILPPSFFFSFWNKSKAGNGDRHQLVKQMALYVEPKRMTSLAFLKHRDLLIQPRAWQDHCLRYLWRKAENSRGTFWAVHLKSSASKDRENSGPSLVPEIPNLTTK